jgi:hypothetical protein
MTRSSTQKYEVYNTLAPKGDDVVLTGVSKTEAMKIARSMNSKNILVRPVKRKAVAE